MKKIFRNLMMLLCALTALVSCDESGDKIYLDGFKASDLMVSTSDVVLSVDKSKDIVLSLAWQNPTLLSSDETKPAGNGTLLTYLQASASQDFSTVKEYTVTNLSKAFTGADLNAAAKDLGLTPDQSAPVYFRIKSQMGANLDAAYSNVCQVNVTPYLIDMSYINILSQDQSETLTYLYSPNSDGVYTGYMNATSWMNYRAKENDGNVWGNSSTKETFVIDNSESAWSLWFPGVAGIYYTEIDTKSAEWKATLLKTVQLNGEDMSYDAPNCAWTKVITTTADNTPINIVATGAEYTKSTGTDDAAAVAKTMNYTLADGKMTDSEKAGSVNIARAGTYTITVKVGENAELTYSIESGDKTQKPDVDPMPELDANYFLCLFSKDGNTKYATFAKESRGIYTCTYDLANKWDMRFYFVDADGNKIVCYGSEPNNQFGIYKETDDSNRQGWDIWFNDDVNGKETVKVTVDLNTMTWKYE